MTTVVSLISAKGGSGKTVLTLSTAKLLTDLGMKVLVIDADAATNGSTLFLLDDVMNAREEALRTRQPLVGLFEMRERTAALDPERTRPVAIKCQFGFDFVPATFELRDTVKSTEVDQLRTQIQGAIAFARHEEYDIVLIDNEAGIEQSAVAAAAQSDRVVIVSEFDPISYDGINRIQRLHGDALPTRNTWVLFNKVLPDFANSISDNLATIKYLPPVAWNVAVVRAYAVNNVDINAGTPTDFTLAVANFCETLFGSLLRQRFDEWRRDTLARFEGVLQKQREVLLVETRRGQSHNSYRNLVAFLFPTVLLLCAGIVAYFSQYAKSGARTVYEALALVLAVGGVTASAAVWTFITGRVQAHSRSDQAQQRLTEINLLLASSEKSTADFATLRARLQTLNKVEELVSTGLGDSST